MDEGRRGAPNWLRDRSRKPAGRKPLVGSSPTPSAKPSHQSEGWGEGALHGNLLPADGHLRGEPVRGQVICQSL